MIRIGLINCGNATQDLNCAAIGCLKANMGELLAPTLCVPQDMNDHIKQRVKLS